MIRISILDLVGYYILISIYIAAVNVFTSLNNKRWDSYNTREAMFYSIITSFIPAFRFAAAFKMLNSTIEDRKARQKH